ncbi:hypothetical protein GEMRC1_000977 [Eukaryota sp. GEM-RC1]
MLSQLVLLTFFVLVCSQSFQKKQFDLLQKEQIPDDQDFDFPYIQKIKGGFPSRIHLNFVGSTLHRILRENLFNIYDNNAFVTSFVIHSVVETLELDPHALDLRSAQALVKEATTAILRFQDKNQDSTVPTFCFWPQEYDKDSKLWVQSPTNLKKPLLSFESFEDYVCDKLEKIHFGFLCDKIEELMPMPMNPNMFNIPSDLDDTSVFLANYFQNM